METEMEEQEMISAKTSLKKQVGNLSTLTKK
jgi:hypothetical protein